ncbi:MAG: amidohydrolase [Bacteroidia bacterium]
MIQSTHAPTHATVSRRLCALAGWLLGGLALACAQLPAGTPLDSLYRHLHRHPELSFHEAATAALLAAELRSLGYEVHEGIGGYGIVGVLRNGEGPVLMVRTDTDALPVVEETGLPYASRVQVADGTGRSVGVMHACGHDMHMSVWVGTARDLAARRRDWRGTLLMVAQPAEERGSGAQAMLADGLYERFPRPDYALALHAHATLPTGTVGLCPGYAMANVDMLDIRVRGRGGHGAYPHTTLDPVVLAARIVLTLQTIVSREISPLAPAVVTVGSIHGGSKGNVIPDEVKLELTLRSYDDAVHAALIEKTRRICTGEALAAGVPDSLYPEVVVRDEHCPSLYNDPDLTAQLEAVLRTRLGTEAVRMVAPVMAGEDFSRYGRTPERVPVMLFWLGTADPDRAAAAARGEISLPSLHSAQFAPVIQPTLDTGVHAMIAAALHLLAR